MEGCEPMATVTVAEDIFTQHEEANEGLPPGWSGDPHFLVVSDDPELAAAALTAAAHRFFDIDSEGREGEGWELGSGDVWTPNFVSDVYLAPEGPMLWVDVKGVCSPAMGRKMLDVLVAELVARDLGAHIATPMLRYDTSAPKWSPRATTSRAAEPAPVPAPAPLSKSWYIGRGVAAVTTTGRHYEEWFWRAADGRWVERRSEAERFDGPPSSLVRALREASSGPVRGEPTGILLPDDDSDFVRMPARSIRQRPTDLF
jgi:hypothetical protein